MLEMTNLLYIPIIFGFSIEVYAIVLILSMPVYLLCRKILKDLIDDNKLRNVAVIAATLVITPIIYGTIILFWILASSYYPSREFSEKRWRKDSDKRYELSEDLIENRLLIGKTKTQIRALLGDEGNDDTMDVWYYDLGYPSFDIDPDVLKIEYNHGKVKEVSQFTE